MKRLLVVSMLSLALAGCAQSKGALSRGASYPPSPVAITPVPSIYDTINQGTGGKALAQTAIKNPDDPQWAGQTQVSVAARPIPPGSPGPASTPASAPAAGPGAASATAVASGPMQSPGQVVGGVPAQAAPAALTAIPGIPNQASPALADAEPMPAPAAAGMPAPASVADARGASPGPLMNDPANVPVAASSSGVRSTGATAADLAVSSPAPSMPATPTAAAPAPAGAAPRRNADPLLGPEPDLMPAMPDLPPVQSTAKQSPPPAGPPALGPAQAPVPGPAPSEPPASEPAASGTLVPAEPPISLEHSTAASKPADGGLAAAVVPLEPAPPPSEVLAANRERAPAPAPAGGPRDSRVILTSGGAPSATPRTRTASLKESGRAVARVGDEVITQLELIAALREEIDKRPELRNGQLDGVSELEKSQIKDVLGRQALVNLIDRSILAQEAKRHIKDKKMLDLIYQEADKVFYEEEVLPLERQLSVDSEAKVKERLAERGRSLDAMRLSHRQVYLAKSYMYQKLKDRIKIELPDLLRYYNEHLYQHEFDRPAQITWRELVVEVDKHKSREEAQIKANALLEKVERGADFTVLARNESEGPSSSRNLGGLMRTTPGSYALKAINDTLDSLPIGQISPVIEGPDSFHIVKVENRRPAGPASFEDVQDKIKPMLQTQRMNQESEAFILKLKQNALIEIYLDKQDPKKS